MPRILVVEDDPHVLLMLRKTLEHGGYVVDGAEDGEAAVRHCREEAIDLVVTDIVMPNRDGLEAIRKLRRDFPHIPIIAISGGGDLNPMSYLAMARQAGADRTFFKPVPHDDLIDAVRQLLAA